MAKKKQLIIPIFIPQQGCPHQCVFCNQSKITGQEKLPDTAYVTDTVGAYLKTWKGSGKKEIAFYGGSFTGLHTTHLRGIAELFELFRRQKILAW